MKKWSFGLVLCATLVFALTACDIPEKKESKQTAGGTSQDKQQGETSKPEGGSGTKQGYSAYRHGNDTHYYDINYKKNKSYLVEVELDGEISQQVRSKVSGDYSEEELLYVDNEAVYLEIFRDAKNGSEYQGIYRIPLHASGTNDLSNVELVFEHNADKSYDTYLYADSQYLVYYDWWKKHCIRYDYDTGEKSILSADFEDAMDGELEIAYGCGMKYDKVLYSYEEDRYLVYDSEKEKLLSPDFGKIAYMDLSSEAGRGPRRYDLWEYESRFLYRRKGEKDIRCYDGKTGDNQVFLTNRQVKELLKEENLYHPGLEWNIDSLDLREGKLYLQLRLNWKEKKAVHDAYIVVKCSETGTSDLMFDSAISDILRKNARCKKNNISNQIVETGRIYEWSDEYLYLYFEKYKKNQKCVFGFYHLPSGKFIIEKYKEGELYAPTSQFYRYMLDSQ